MPKKSTPITFYIEQDKLAVVESLCEALDMGKSEFIRIAVDNALSDWSYMKRLGLTPQRLGKLAKALKSLGLIRSEKEFLEREVSAV